MDTDLDDLIGPPMSPAEVDATDAAGARPSDAELPEVPRKPRGQHAQQRISLRLERMFE